MTISGAQIRKSGLQTCGATIISEYWLITAGHCLSLINSNDESNVQLDVVVGTNFLDNGGNVYQIRRKITHKNFNLDYGVNSDIGLIQVDKKIEFSDVQKPIPIGNVHPKAGDFIEVAGFGTVGENKKSSPLLKSAVLPVVSKTKCVRIYGNVFPHLYNGGIANNTFCAGANGDDTCKGDSGGPAVMDGKLVGVISWGYYCGSWYIPGVYTMLKKYRKWIAKHTGLTL